MTILLLIFVTTIRIIVFLNIIVLLYPNYKYIDIDEQLHKKQFLYLPRSS